MSAPFDAVLLVSFGGPQGPDDIRPFLANVLRGRRVSPERVEEVAHHYELFDGVSPITELTRRQAEGLRSRLVAAAHHSYSSCQQYRENVAAAQESLRANGGGHLDVTFVDSWFDHPLFVAAN